jgi:hypothetical protein
MRRGLPLLTSFLLAACGQAVPVGNAAADANDTAPDTVTPSAAPVRIGELGANFAACGAAGTTRHLETGERLPVRSAPFETAAQTGQVAAGAEFFVCTRSVDQQWLGIVYDASGRLEARCGVGDPVADRRDYGGPCASGWVSAPFVRLVAGDAPRPANPSEEAAAGNTGG